MEFVLDFDTIRLLPHLPATAMIQCDLVLADHQPGRAVAAHDPQAPAEAGRRRRLRRAGRHRAGVHPLRGHLRERLERRLPRPHAEQPVQRRLLHPGHDARRAAAARHPQLHARRRHERRGRQGRVQLRPARDRLPVRRGAGDRRQPRGLQDGRQGDRRRCTARRSRSCRSSTRARATPATSTCPCAGPTARRCSGTRTRRAHAALRPLRRRRARHDDRLHAALRPEHQLLQAVRRRLVRARRRSPGGSTTAPAPYAWSGTAPRPGWRTGCPAAT